MVWLHYLSQLNNCMRIQNVLSVTLSAEEISIPWVQQTGRGGL